MMDESSSVRMEAVWPLEKELRDKRALDILKHASRDENFTVRRRADGGLEKIRR